MAAEKPSIPEPGSLTWPFRLGDRVKDKINGLEGTATNRFFHMTGCDRFAVELDPKDGQPGEYFHADGNRLELVKSNPDHHREEVPDVHYKLGDKVRSLVDRLEGSVHSINVPLFGSTQASVHPPWDPKEKKMPDGFMVDSAFVDVITPYTPRPKAETKPKPNAKQERGATSLGRGWL